MTNTATERDAARYRFWRKYYSTRFAIKLAPGLICGTMLHFDPNRPNVEPAGPEYELRVDAALDAAMADQRAKP